MGIKNEKKRIVQKKCADVIYATVLIVIYFMLFQIKTIENFDLEHQVLTGVITVVYIAVVISYMRYDIRKYINTNARSNPLFPWC